MFERSKYLGISSGLVGWIVIFIARSRNHGSFFQKTLCDLGGPMGIDKCARAFLMLISFFPSGTQHHYFVSTWFFTQTDLYIIAWGIGLINKRDGIIFLGPGLIGPMIAYLVNWPSTAIIEVYRILIMNIWIVLMMKQQ